MTKKITKISLLLFFVHLALCVHAGELYKTNADLRLRKGPGTKYKSIVIIKKGEKLSVVDKSDSNWFKVDYYGRSGYLSSKYLVIVPVEVPEENKTLQIETVDDTQTSNYPFYILGVLVIVILVGAFSASSKSKQAIPISHSNNNHEDKSSKIRIHESSRNNKLMDNSIIDVTNQASENIPNPKNNIEVPSWPHKYIYSYSDIEGATMDQKIFYTVFKSNFLKGECLDLNGNINYAFILLFDLLDGFEKDNNISKIEKQLELLGKHYPKTKYYGTSFLVKQIKSKGKDDVTVRLREKEKPIHETYMDDYGYWKLGSKYKAKLNLTEDEEILLNKLWQPTNNFCSIEFCCIEVLRLYILTISELKNKYVEQGTTLEAEFISVAEMIAKKHYKYRAGTGNYSESINASSHEFYTNIFKHCENALRDYYGHKRKINADFYFYTTEIIEDINIRIISKVSNIFPTLISKIRLPDQETEIELNSQNTSRWKLKFEDLIANYKGDPKKFVESIVKIGKLNIKNPSIENIFFEASKFISKHHKESALILYVHYLYHDLKSTSFDNKQLTKTVQKSLFKSNEQLHDFEIIVSNLIKDKNLEKALLGVSQVYAVKRKKIKLDKTSIHEVQQQHHGTVELLNEYLKDEYEDETNIIKSQEVNGDEVKIEIVQKNGEAIHSIYSKNIALTEIHTLVLELFAKGNFSLQQSEIESFAKPKGVFKNQLIESINDLCYESLDDVLIEEEDEYYTINPNYYQKILAK